MTVNSAAGTDTPAHINRVSSGAGRYAPSPTGDLHLGNLRTALLAWLYARSTGRRFLLRFEDLDVGRADPRAAAGQEADLLAMGLDFDGSPVFQTERRALYRDAIDRLRDAGLTYPCYCSRREIHAAVAAPHAPPGAYPGTCRSLTAAELSEKQASGRPPALRLRTDATEFTVTDLRHGPYTGGVDDFVLQRGDGTPAYNLAVVVDDGDMGVDQVVRGDDLLNSAPRQAYLAGVLGITPPVYAHVPLVLGPDRARLAKRDGAVTLHDRLALGESAEDVLGTLAVSLNLADEGEPVRPNLLIERWDPAMVPDDPWVFDAAGEWLRHTRRRDDRAHLLSRDSREAT